MRGRAVGSVCPTSRCGTGHADMRGTGEGCEPSRVKDEGGGRLDAFATLTVALNNSPLSPTAPHAAKGMRPRACA